VLSGPASRFVRVETLRLLTAPVSVVTLALFAAFQVYAVVAWTGACAAPEYAAAAGGYSCTTAVSVSYLLPIVAAIVGGTAAAAERTRGADVLLAVRGLAGGSYARARIVAGALAAAAGVVLTGLVAIAAGIVAHPWRMPLEKNPDVIWFNGPPRHIGDPSPWLWAHAPLLNDVAALLIVGVAAAAVAAFGTALGMWVRSPIAVLPVVVGAMLAAQYTVPSPLNLGLDPLELLDFAPTSGMVRALPPPLLPVVHLAAWVIIMGVSFPAAAAGARRALR
jgi:hypothetical protein